MRACLKLIQILMLLAAPSALAKKKMDPTSACEKPAHFRDADLDALKKKHDEFIIYIWSPYMPLSVEGRRHIETWAQEIQIPATVTVLDPSQRICHEKTGALADPSFDSKELIEARALNHYPTMVYYRKGVLKAMVPGFDDAEKFKNRIADLRKGSPQ
ncbi:MAG: hypothetical protein KF681_05775 [Bdellovibrionaceae bacterium]|nr:hypothetical protein [Pseudobdellovibrionaceae bacterium]